MTFFAKAAMALSLSYYFLLFGFVWIGEMLGIHGLVWDMFDFPEQDTSPPFWTLVVGLILTLIALVSLAGAFRGAWLVLKGGPEQDFRDLGRNLRHMACGLIGFWIGYNVIALVMPHLIVIGLESTEGFDFSWAPLDLDIVFAITGVVLLAISQTLERAWQAEDENKHFL